MKELQERLKTVKELLNHAKIIRSKAGTSMAGEANDWENKLETRAAELEGKIRILKQHPEPDLAHA